MSYLIDSDWLIDALAGSQRALSLLDQLIPTEPAISAISVAEVCDGAHGAPDPALALLRVQEFLSNYEILPVSQSVAERFAAERAMLRRRGMLIDDMDLLIAATALEHGLTMVTRNHRHFARIPGLRIWQT
ncbi:MAG: type II toxin-antitoxin system VapC family toxin [Thermomicrobiales bacterium]|nr:type II toxin-antitoxin system VapC family toxin [Thermomicrobiales bacterium]